MKYIIDESCGGKTVKSYLFGTLHFSRALVVRLKEKENGIVLNGRRVVVTEVLSSGDVLELAVEDAERGENIRQTEMPLAILFEDDRYIAVNKPPALPTHPSLYHYDDTLANGLAWYFAKKGRPFVFRTVNRLDRDTSGVVLVSKDKDASAKMNRLIAARKADKRYIALVDGDVAEDHGFIEKNIARAEESIILRRVCKSGGEYALTEYTVLERKNGKTLLCATPHTGRTHQLRVHFAYLGHPIEGDDLYGETSPHIARQALHALELSFDHPFTGERVEIFAPPPEDLKKLLKEYGFETVFQESRGSSQEVLFFPRK